MSSISRDRTKNCFNERIGSLVINIKKDDKTKAVGLVKINLAEFVDMPGDTEETSKNGKRQRCLLEKCPDKKANVCFTIKSSLISSNSAETLTTISEAIDVDSGPESECNFD